MKITRQMQNLCVLNKHKSSLVQSGMRKVFKMCQNSAQSSQQNYVQTMLLLIKGKVTNSLMKKKIY